MGNFLKKAKKLVLQPRKFFIDRQRKIESSKLQKNNPGHSSNFSAKKQKPEHKVYINTNFTTSGKLRSHTINIFSEFLNISSGIYRTPSNDVIFDIKGNVFIAELNTPVENNIITKGHLLLTPKEYPEQETTKQYAIFLDAVHKINVEHMKSVGDFKLLYSYYETRPERSDYSQIKYALMAGIYETPIIEKAVEILDSSALAIPQKDAILLFKKTYRVIGTDQKLERIANNIASAIKKESYPNDFIMFIAAFFTESGDYKKAIELANIAKDNDIDAWSKNRYLALSHLLYTSGLTSENATKQDHDLFILLSRNEWELENYLAINFMSLAIVGNSPIELLKRKGCLIDQHKKVLRFNGAITDHPHCLDYGKKTTILVTNPRYYETQRNRKYDLDYIVISDGNLYATKDLFSKIHDLHQFAEKICLLPRKVDLFLTQKICASPSSGLKVLTWLHMINGPIARENLFGFSLTDQDHGVATSYAGGRKVGLNTIHNWSSENAHLDTIVTKEKLERV